MRRVPHTPLLWVAFLAGVPAFTVLIYDDGLGRIAGVVVLLVFAAVAALDWIVSRSQLDGMECGAPPLLRGTVGRPLEVPLEFTNRGRTLERLRYGLSISPFFRLEGEVIGRIRKLESGKGIVVGASIIPLRRGRHSLDSLHLESRSALGLWLLRKGFPLETEIRAYPDLRMERRRLAALFLMRGQEGNHLVRQVGKGRDFEQLRDYQPGDDYIDIDWKATARRNTPVTRTYQIEKTQEVYVVVDHSRLSGREIRLALEEVGETLAVAGESSVGGDQLVTTQLEKFLHCALVLASVAERQGDRFGFVSFADQVGRFIRAGNGKGHYNLVRDTLYTLEPKQVAPDFEQLMIALRQRITRRALVVMLVDLSDPLTAEHFFEALPLITRQHLVLVSMVRPERAHPLFSPRSLPESATDIYERLGGHLQWQELREVARKLHYEGVELGTPDHAELCAETVTRYLNVKKRQLI